MLAASKLSTGAAALCAFTLLLSGCSGLSTERADARWEADRSPVRDQDRGAHTQHPATRGAPESDAGFLEQYRSGLAELHGLSEPPVVAVIRRVAPAEQSDLVATCMEDRGWPVEVDPDGGVMASVPNHQMPALNESWYVCWASYPPLAQYLRPLDDDQLGQLYDYYVDDLTPCLQAEGYLIEPPSRAVWLHDASTSDRHWMPYFDVDGTPTNDVFQRCPASPGDDLLFSGDE